ncbi:hypothetical protein MMC34_007041 [Xylographa carneopallida]|nr:hypothetical protein [Xylographa carneopallida]
MEPFVGEDLAHRLDHLREKDEFLLGNDKWVIKDSFDHGPTSAVVKLVYNRRSSTELLVCKAVPQNRNTPEVPKEVRVLLEVLPKNERLCAILEYFPAPENVFLMEYCDGGDLAGLLHRYRLVDEFLPESFIWHVLLQVAEGLAYIHHGRSQTAIPKHQWSPVIHADIKPENIFLQWAAGFNLDTDYPDLKLGDFGLAIIVNERIDEPPYSYAPGTHIWRPPEQPLVSFKADVWGLGAVIHYLCHGFEPLERAPTARGRDVAATRDVVPITNQFSRALQYWVDQVLEKDPVKRIDSAVLADSLARIVPVFLGKWRPLDSWAAIRPGDRVRGLTPPRVCRSWRSQNLERTLVEPLHDDNDDQEYHDEPPQEYTEYVQKHSSLSFALNDDANPALDDNATSETKADTNSEAKANATTEQESGADPDSDLSDVNSDSELLRELYTGKAMCHDCDDDSQSPQDT